MNEMQIFFRKILFAVIIFLGSSFVWAGCDLLIVAYDNGDALAMKAVTQELDLRIKKGEKFNYKILAFGNSAAKFEAHPHLLEVKNCEGFSTKLPLKWKRNSIFPEETVDCIIKSADPKKLMIGLASFLQAQFAQKASEKNIETIGFYDAFHNPSDLTNDFDITVREVVKSVNNIIVPYQALRESFQNLNSHAAIHVLGQPTYETWMQDVEKYSPENTLKKLGYTQQRPSQLIVFSGGYDDVYKKSFENILVKVLPFLKDTEILITLHPKLKTDDSYEKSRIGDYKNVRVLLPRTPENPDGFTTEEVSGVADVIVCVRSTTGIKAALAGQAVVYIDVDPENYTNPLIEKGVVPQVSTPEALIQALNRVHKPKKTIEQLAKQIEMPVHADKKIADYLIEER